MVGWSKASEFVITGLGTGPWSSRTTLKQHQWACVVDYTCVHVDTHLHVRSLSSSWRSLQCSSVCLQEHRHVTGSCTNRRFLLSVQWSQHGSQTLDGETETEVGRESERERLLRCTVSSCSSKGRPSVCPVIYSCLFFPVTAGQVCWWASIAHRRPPSRQASKQ